MSNGLVADTVNMLSLHLRFLMSLDTLFCMGRCFLKEELNKERKKENK